MESFTQLNTPKLEMEEVSDLTSSIIQEIVPNEALGIETKPLPVKVKNVDTHVCLFIILSIVTFAVAVHIFCHVITIWK